MACGLRQDIEYLCALLSSTFKLGILVQNLIPMDVPQFTLISSQVIWTYNLFNVKKTIDLESKILGSVTF